MYILKLILWLNKKEVKRVINLYVINSSIISTQIYYLNKLGNEKNISRIRRMEKVTAKLNPFFLNE